MSSFINKMLIISSILIIYVCNQDVAKPKNVYEKYSYESALTELNSLIDKDVHNIFQLFYGDKSQKNLTDLDCGSSGNVKNR